MLDLLRPRPSSPAVHGKGYTTVYVFSYLKTHVLERKLADESTLAEVLINRDHYPPQVDEREIVFLFPVR